MKYITALIPLLFLFVVDLCLMVLSLVMIGVVLIKDMRAPWPLSYHFAKSIWK